MTHIVPRITSSCGGGGRRRAAHVPAVRNVLLIRGRWIVHHVAVRHVTIGHLVNVSRQLRLLRPACTADLPLINAQHPADSGHSATQRELVLLQQRFCLASWPVFVIRVLFHVNGA